MQQHYAIACVVVVAVILVFLHRRAVSLGIPTHHLTLRVQLLHAQGGSPQGNAVDFPRLSAAYNRPEWRGAEAEGHCNRV